jgi:hypothetical protein
MHCSWNFHDEVVIFFCKVHGADSGIPERAGCFLRSLSVVEVNDIYFCDYIIKQISVELIVSMTNFSG